MIDPRILHQFDEWFGLLLVADVQRRLTKLPVEQCVETDRSKWRFLVSAASRFALGVDFPDEIERAHRMQQAYDVVTRLAVCSAAEQPWIVAADAVLARLGNFPGRELLRTLAGNSLGQAPYPLTLQLEAASREAENTVRVVPGREMVLTDFQVRLFGALASNKFVSVSAPTSAGKSFILALDIVRRLLKNRRQSIVYLVPTRALIRQVVRDVNRELLNAELLDVAVLSAPIPVEAAQLQKGVVYVLTQERLMTLLYSEEGQPAIDVLFVDEAQELGDDQRGLLLHSAVERTLEMFPRTEVFFSSPLKKNPGFLLSEFGLTTEGHFFTEQHSPVSQTILVLDEVSRRTHDVAISVLGPRGLERVGTVVVDFEFRGNTDRLARTALEFTLAGETSIVYANTPRNAEDGADELAGLLPTPEVVDPEIRELIDFLRTHVHRQYALVEYLPKGVAFHYGNMPHIIRGRVEDLLRNGKVKFVFCTSTLLQGVNLPAKNIFVHGPRRGRGQLMTSADFWNLVGRAGRLRQVFNGNVWCLLPRSWGEDPTTGDRTSSVASAFREALSNPESISEILVAGRDRAGASTGSLAEQTFAKLCAEFTAQNKQIATSTYAQGLDVNRLAQLDTQCASVISQLQVPMQVCRQNSTISPWRLEELYQLFSTATNIEAMIPHDPRRPGALNSMKNVFAVIEQVFLKTGNNRHMYLASLAYFWIHGRTLAELITNRLQYNQVGDDQRAINRHIRELLEDLEQELHFRYVKYLRAYHNVLEAVLRAKRREDLLASIPPLYLYVEMGAHEKVVINLMSIGLSRTTAILLRRGALAGWSDEIPRDQYMTRLRDANLSTSSLPAVCLREVQELVG